MFEKVNPSHPDKIADRIAGAIVDLAYRKETDPKIAVEVLIGHGVCHIIAETTVFGIETSEVEDIVERIVGQQITVLFDLVPQDRHLAENQQVEVRCGDNGIFRGVPITHEQSRLSNLVREMYEKHPTDGKFILANDRLTACQSCVDSKEFERELKQYEFNDLYVNPLGDWTGGTDVDTGATNRKLGSDMGDAVTGGGLHGKDLSKADVSVNIYAHIRAQQLDCPVELSCAIGDKYVDGLPYAAIVEIARDYIREIGGFEKFAEWGLV